MKAIFGLGNPGRKYQGTRHNVGFEVIDELKDRRRVLAFDSFTSGSWSAEYAWWRTSGGDRTLLAKPQTFMNASGEAVSGLAGYYDIDPSGVLLVVDEAQLPLGRIRLRRSGSSGGHNGLKSVIQYLGPEFPRLRIGVGRGDPSWDLADHVLARFDPDELEIVKSAITRAADAVEMFVEDGIEAAMNCFNAKEDKSSEEDTR